MVMAMSKKKSKTVHYVVETVNSSELPVIELLSVIGSQGQ